MANPKKKPRDLCDILDELLDSFEMVEHETTQAEQAELEKLAKKQEDFDNAATDMRMMYESFLDAGFDERQSFQLLCVIVGNGMKGGQTHA